MQLGQVLKRRVIPIQNCLHLILNVRHYLRMRSHHTPGPSQRSQGKEHISAKWVSEQNPHTLAIFDQDIQLADAEVLKALGANILMALAAPIADSIAKTVVQRDKQAAHTKAKADHP